MRWHRRCCRRPFPCQRQSVSPFYFLQSTVFSSVRWRSGGHSNETQRIPDGAKKGTRRADCLSPFSHSKKRCRYLPHACQKLNQSTIAESDAHHQIGLAQPTCAHIDQTQHKCCQCESAQTQGSGIGNFAVLDLLVQTRLEFTSKGREAIVT